MPDPSPGEDEALVHIRAAALGPWDLAGADGAFASMGGSSAFPQVQGWDFAGETADGRRVVGFVPQPWMGVGTFAELISLPEGLLAELPDGLGFPEGSALPVCGLTARLLLDAAAVTDGDLVLITGAGGMVGGFATQLAVARGARVVAAVRDSDANEARRLGAEAVVSTDTGLDARVRGQWQQGVDACVETIGLGADALACVRDDGQFVTSVPTATPDAQRGINAQTVQVQPDSGATADLAARAAAGELTVRIADTLPLESFHEAYSRLGRGGLRGKIVFTP